ncbi:hypothetical protein [Kitasatospora sp. NPDC057015]|uniref:hypothetical protein n=1 Tax=Kitasatospora sp. NPDC057015 TaxID=3346001 RepID=UPI00363B3B63
MSDRVLPSATFVVLPLWERAAGPGPALAFPVPGGRPYPDAGAGALPGPPAGPLPVSRPVTRPQGRLPVA